MEVLFRRSKLPVTTLLDPFRGPGLSFSMSRCAPAILAGALGLLQLGCAGAPPVVLPALPTELRLEPGHPLERELAGRQTDELPLTLKANQYVRLTFDQKRMDVAVSLLGPAGEIIVSVDGPGGRREPEILSWLTTAGGHYRVVVTPHDPKLQDGRYTVTLEELRPARPGDGDRVRAEAALSEATHRRLSKKDVPRAFEKAQESLSLWKQIGDPVGEIKALLELAEIYYLKADSPAMLGTFRQALSLSRASQYGAGEAEALKMLAAFDQGLALETRASYFDRSSEIWQNLGDTGKQASALFEKGYFEFGNGKFSEAMVLFRSALELAEEAGARRLQADIWNGIGGVHTSRGERGEALECYKHALDLVRQEENDGAKAAALYSLALLHRRRGELQSALPLLLTALDINQRLASSNNEGQVLLNLGGVYLDLGDTDQALTYYEKARELFHSSPDRKLEGLTLIQLGLVYSALKEWQAALEHFEQAWIISSETDHKKRMAAAMHGGGVSQLNLGQTAKAIASLEQALPLRQEAGDRTGEASTLLELGRAYQAQGNSERAVSLMNEALHMGQRAEASFVQAEALFSLSKVERDRGNLRDALRHIEQSVQILERVRSNLAGDRLRSSFFASKRSYYDLYVDLLMRLGKQALAFETSERARARSLLDLLVEGRLDLKAGISPELKEHERDVAARLSDLQTELVEELSQKNPQADRVADLHARLDAVAGERQDLESKIAREHPRYAKVRYPSPLVLQEIQNQLDQDTALLEYSLGQEGSYLFVVTRDQLTAVNLPDAQRISDGVLAVRSGVRQPGRRSFATYSRAAYQLYRELIAPARHLLAGKHRLLIAPDGPLHALSFDVLLTDEDRGREFADLPYLVRDFSVSYIPSASVLSWLSDPQPSALTGSEPAKRFLAFADPIYGPETEDREIGPLVRGSEPRVQMLESMPRLEGTAREAKAIADLYPAAEVQLYERGQANEENVKSNPLVERAQRIHFATHGVLNERQPELSGLLLTRTPQDDGLLRVHEIFNLNLHADLVVLSACDTGGGKELAGEGLMGMTRAFLYAGTPSVVVSLWQVADAQAPDLMRRFYEALDRKGDKAEALRQAKLEKIRERTYARPYYWASFVLVGKP